MSNQRLIAFFSGHVQGVGFRYTTHRIAGRFQVTGYVKNLPDGRVEVVAEGTVEEVKKFFAEVSETMGQYISEAKSGIQAANGEFLGFEVRF